MPGPEKPLLHIAIEFVEMLDNALAEHQMLNVAHGELPGARRLTHKRAVAKREAIKDVHAKMKARQAMGN